MAHIETKDGITVLVDEWHLEDVHCAADDMGITITDDEAEDVLSAIAHGYDANIGINWELFYYYLRDYRKEEDND